MALYFDEAMHGEAAVLICDTLESLEGASSMMETLAKAPGSPGQLALMHAVGDVLVVCRERMERVATMLDQ